MAERELKSLLLQQLQDHQAHSIRQLVETTLQSHQDVYESDVKSTLLGLVRRNELDLTDDYRVQLPQGQPILQRG